MEKNLVNRYRWSKKAKNLVNEFVNETVSDNGKFNLVWINHSIIVHGFLFSTFSTRPLKKCVLRRYKCKAVGTGGAARGGAIAPLSGFVRSVNPIPNRGEGADYANHVTALSGFSDLPRALICRQNRSVIKCTRAQRRSSCLKYWSLIVPK